MTVTVTDLSAIPLPFAREWAMRLRGPGRVSHRIGDRRGPRLSHAQKSVE